MPLDPSAPPPDAASHRYGGAAAALLLTASLGACAPAGPSTPSIRAVNGSASEEARVEQIRRVLDRWDVEPWIYTREIQVEDRVVPHSHPVLTLNARAAPDDEVLATFLHEQFHWLEDAQPGFRAAMRAFADAYPDAPAGGPEGARDLESTYRHLVVNDLEYQALTALVGQDRAREILAGHRFYTWIYDRVLDDPEVRRILRAHGMTLDEVAVR
ncbi:MAG: hypothetical protein RJQ04_05810 [Longimicrobiales bacterium]